MGGLNADNDHRTSSIAANIPTSRKSKATKSDSSTTQRHTTTRSRSSTRMPSASEKRHLTGWSSTTPHIESTATRRSLRQCPARSQCRTGSPSRAFSLQHRDLQYLRRTRPRDRDGRRQHNPLLQRRQNYDSQPRLSQRKQMMVQTSEGKRSSRRRIRSSEN